MKINTATLFLLLLLISSSICSQAQSTTNAPYIGTWEYNNGNQVFSIVISEDTSPNPYDGQYYLKGEYKMEEKANSEETILYASNTSNNSNEEPDSYALNGVVNNNNYSGVFNEKHSKGFALIGNFEITSLTSSQISFRVSKRKGINIYPSGIAPKTEFEVPNNITLTKKQ